ncbi:unnamed protein product [Psylliodes chrysocephalus]|uniref:Uncharacterized protein n=1 Tax=Psylliodes chrysocephalus TaxID=3402493 RepID=A0A9P0GL18_9CUCU|nr:unnamed protein product [Psylliodes chrysocephala]
MGTLIDSRFKQEGFRSINNAKVVGQFSEQEMVSILNRGENKETNEDQDRKNSSMSSLNKGSNGGNSNKSSSSSSSSSSSLFSFMNERTSHKRRSKKVVAIIIKRQYLERQNLN